MSEEPCIHLLDPATCSICSKSAPPQATQRMLNFGAISRAVDDLGAHGPFRTIDIVRHPEVQAAHPEVRKDPQFNQHIGMYLTGATGRLRITQASPKGRSNATWKRVAENGPNTADGHS